MAFVISDKMTVEWPVDVQVPQNGGKTKTHTFTATFEILSQDEYDRAILLSVKDHEFIAKIMVGFEGLLDDNGHEIEYNDDNLYTICKYPFMRVAIIQAYNAASTGAITKN